MDMSGMELMTRTFSVPFTHRVIFTRRVAGAGNPALDEALGDSRLAMLVVEDAVAAAWPDLVAELSARLGARMAGAAMVLPGGEACKQDESVYRAKWRRCMNAGLTGTARWWRLVVARFWMRRALPPPWRTAACGRCGCRQRYCRRRIPGWA